MTWKKLCCANFCWLLGLVAILSGPLSSSIGAQVEAKGDKAYKTASEQIELEEKLKTEIEPGVFVVGKAHRFAEVGDCDSFSLSPDGKTIACSGSRIKLFDLEADKVRETVGEEGETYQGVEFSDDGRFLVGHTYKHSSSLIRVWDAVDLSLLNSFSANEGVKSANARASFYIQQFKVSPENNYIAACDYRSLVVRDLKTGELVYQMDDLGWAIQGISFSPDDRQLLVPKSGSVQVIDLESGELLSGKDSKVAGAIATVLDVNSAQQVVATANGGSIRIIDLEGSKRKRMLSLPAGAHVQNLKFSDDGKLIAASVWQSGDNVYQIGVVILDVASGKTVKHKKKTGVAGQNLGRMQFATNNHSLFYSGPAIHGINEVDLLSTEPDSESKFPKSPVKSSAIHPDNQSFVACTSAGDVNSFDINSGEILKSFSYANPKGLQLSSDGNHLLISSNYGQTSLQAFDYRSGKAKKSYTLRSKGSVFSHLSSFMKSGTLNTIHSQSYPISVALSSDGAEVNVVGMEITYKPIGGSLTGEYDQRNLIQFAKLDAENGRMIGQRSFRNAHFGLQENDWAHLGAVSHDGTRMAVGKADKLTVVETATGETLYEVSPGKNDQLRSAEFSPDDRFLIAVMSTKVVVRDAESGETVAELVPEKRKGNLVTGFSGNGKRFVVCNSAKDGEVQIYSTESWEPVFERDKTQHDRMSVSISNDGQLVLFGLSDCRLEIWDRAKLK